MSKGARLRTRVTVSFLIAALPTVAVFGGAFAVIDDLIQAEIDRRAEETFKAVTRGLDAETERVQRALEALAKQDAIRSLANTVDHAAAVDRAEGVAPLLSSEARLTVFAVVAARGPLAGTLVSSAHLPTAAGDLAPEFATPRAALTATVGIASELVAGNPPVNVPVLLAVRPVSDRAGARSIILYGGRRLDGAFLTMLAQTGGATLLFDTPDGDRLEFPPRGGSASQSHVRRMIPLPLLSGAQGSAARAPQISVAVDTSRLETTREQFTLASAAVAAAIIIIALIAGAWLARPVTEPILEVSQAAKEVASGRLDVRITKRRDDEVGELVDVFNEMVAEIASSRDSLARAERIAAWRHVARQVAHEIKNPLTPMRMAMETLRKAYDKQHPDLDAIVEESTVAVLDEVRSLSRIVSEFSEFARLPKPRLEDIAPGELIDSTARLYASVPDGVRVEVDLPDGTELPAIRVDREQIGRALINLVKNAIEALESTGGCVTLSARRARQQGRDGVTLEVRDDGPGMPEEVREKVFTPYFTTKPSGTGLGLAIVERIIDEHDGSIDLDSSSAGTTFRLWLPPAA